MIDFEFEPEQETLRSVVREFGRHEVAPHCKEWEGVGVFPPDILMKLGEMGLLGLGIPSTDGGSDSNFVSMGIAAEELGSYDMSLAALCLVTMLTGRLIAKTGTEDIRDEWLRGITEGTALVALGLTEPEAGSDIRGMRTTVRKDGKTFVLSGEKNSVSLVNLAAATIVFARDEQAIQGKISSSGVSAFVVPRDANGISISRFNDLGCRALARGVMSFDETVVPEECLLGERGRAMSMILGEFDFSRAIIGLLCLGGAMAASREAGAYAMERRVFGRPLSDYQGVAFELAEDATLLEAAKWLCYRTLWLRDRGFPHTKEAAMVKWWTPLVAYQAIQRALVIHGHGAYSDGLGLEKRLRDVIGFQIADGTPHVQKIIIARALLGRQAADS